MYRFSSNGKPCIFRQRGESVTNQLLFCIRIFSNNSDILCVLRSFPLPVIIFMLCVYGSYTFCLHPPVRHSQVHTFVCTVTLFSPSVYLWLSEFACRVREPPCSHSLPKERNVRLLPHSAHASITHNNLSAQLDWNISLFFCQIGVSSLDFQSTLGQERVFIKCHLPLPYYRHVHH